MRVNLKCTAVEVRNPASRIAKGAPETTGAVRYKVTGSVDGKRVYLALGTDHKGTAERRVKDIETACVIGPDARTWNDVWAGLEERLPKKTFDYFAGKARSSSQNAPRSLVQNQLGPLFALVTRPD